jgi:hypothetical protein
MKNNKKVTGSKSFQSYQVEKENNMKIKKNVLENELLSSNNLKDILIEELNNIEEKVEQMKIDNLNLIQDYENEVHTLQKSNDYLLNIQSGNHINNAKELEDNINELKEQIINLENEIKEKDKIFKEVNKKILELNNEKRDHNLKMKRLKDQYRNQLIDKINNKNLNLENKEENKNININNEIKENDDNNNQFNQNSIQDMIENNEIENNNNTTPQ